MTDFADLRARPSYEKIEVHSLVRLHYGGAKELDPAAIRVRLKRCPLCPASRELGVRNVQMDFAFGDVDFDQIAVLDQRKRSLPGESLVLPE